MAKKINAHFSQGESTPNIELIISDLIDQKILPNKISPSEIRSSPNEIIVLLEKATEKIGNRESMEFIVSFVDINIRPSAGYMLRSKKKENIPDEYESLMYEIESKKISIENEVSRILMKSLNFRSRIRTYDLNKSILSELPHSSYYDKLISDLLEERSPFFDKEKLNEVNNFFNNLINKKGVKTVIISIPLKEFLFSFLARIDILKNSGEGEKNDLINQFEKRKTQKIKQSKYFLRNSIGLFFIILLINICSYSNGTGISFDEFIKNFIGKNIYLLAIEVFLIFGAFYFLSLYKSYLKIIELYDSHILLVESDFFYKNDPHFQDENHKGSLFKMRKENAQKIHMLPEKTFDILNGKESIKDSPNLVKITENILDGIKK